MKRVLDHNLVSLQVANAAVFDYFLSRSELPVSEVEWLAQQGRRRILAKGDPFCQIGQARHEYGLLEDGILQVYSVRSDGAHAVLDFLFAGQLALAYEGAVSGSPSKVCFEAVTRCSMIVWPYELRSVALSRSPAWERLSTRLAEDVFLRKHDRFMSLRTRTAEERYSDLVHDLPPEWTKIPQHVLASFLDVTPQYLSRLRRRASTTVRKEKKIIRNLQFNG